MYYYDKFRGDKKWCTLFWIWLNFTENQKVIRSQCFSHSLTSQLDYAIRHWPIQLFPPIPLNNFTTVGTKGTLSLFFNLHFGFLTSFWSFSRATSDLLAWCDSRVHPVREGTCCERYSNISCRLTSKRVWWDLIRSKHVTWLWCSH